MSFPDMDFQQARCSWHPIAACDDLPLRHVFHARLLGREMAVWRADDGHVNVWENRCLHRGVRLSIGINDGVELVCQYHGWRYANRTASCTYIPAHPADSPARTICNHHYPAVEHNGMIWTCDDPQRASTKPATQPIGDANTFVVLRAIPVNAPVDMVAKQLQRHDIPWPTSLTTGRLQLNQVDDFIVAAEPTETDERLKLCFYLQPVDSNKTIIRGLTATAPELHEHIALLRACNQCLDDLRASAEQAANALPSRPVWTVPLLPAAATTPLQEMRNASGTLPLRVSVAKLYDTATDIKALEIASLDEPLPSFQPGAHIDVQLPNGSTRQYSLANTIGQTDRYVLGIKKETDSTGGSSYVHDTLRTGDNLAISLPRNNFPLRRDAVETLFIAGGIGLTPLLSMATALQHAGRPFQFHYFVRDHSHVAFKPVLNTLQPHVHLHTGLSADRTRELLHTLLDNHVPDHHVYLCGPEAMLSAARTIAAESGWPDDSVHFEYFKNNTPLDQGEAFNVSLARSGLNLDVPADQSLLDVLRANGVDLPSSCEQGACGTCKVAVLQGTPLHRDVYLSATARQQGNCMMSCVSRASGASLILDI